MLKKIIATTVAILILMSATFAQTPITFSVYSKSLHGGPVAMPGKRYNMHELTCASNVHRLGTVLAIRARGSKKTVYVTVTDRMAKRFTGVRIDLSSAAMAAIQGRSVKNYRYTIVRGTYTVVSTPSRKSTKGRTKKRR